MNKNTHFTVYDTVFDLSEPKDCDQLVDMIETFGAMHTWSMYDLLCTVDQTDGCEASYKEWLKNIAQKFGKVIDTEREICLDDSAVKTILSQYIRNIDRYFKSNGGKAFMAEQFTLPAFGSANEDRYVPVERVEVLNDYPDHLVTRVVEPERDANTGLTRIGNVDNFSIMVYTVNIAGKTTQQFGLQHPDDDAEITDSVHEIAQNLFDDYLSRQEAE
ncbi:hypothetical protein PSNIH1_14605 [Pantoea sp. PSNIH1]|nr:hypothetical protein PSNIH1_14605 [Pantoea sp. PSNIH1]